MAVCLFNCVMMGFSVHLGIFLNLIHELEEQLVERI
jgi:hypothetical protein